MCSVKGFQMSHYMARMSNHHKKNKKNFIECYLNLSEYFLHPEMGDYEQNGPLNLKSLTDTAWFKLKVTSQWKQILPIGLFGEH